MSDGSPAWQKFGFKSQEHWEEYISKAPERRRAFMEQLTNSETFRAILEKHAYKAMKNKTDG
jgi:protein-disulfide isomerase